jgi:hypothetical protein
MTTIVTSRTRIFAGAAVVWTCVVFAPAARADILAPAGEQLARARLPIDAIEQAAEGNLRPRYSADTKEAATGETDAIQAQVLAAILLIPPPVDIVVDIPTATPEATPPMVVGGPDLVIHTVPGGVNGSAIQSESAPEPTSLLLAASGAGLAAAGAWYRRWAARRAKEVSAAEMAAA